MLKGEKVLATHRKTSQWDEFDSIAQSYHISKDELEKGLHWVELSLENTPALYEWMLQVAYVIHVAGMISYLKNDRQKLIFNNAFLTGEIVNTAIAAKIKKLVYISSISTLCFDKNKEFINEENEWDDKMEHSFYGFSKYKGECEVWRGVEEGLTASILNPGIILGFGDWNHGSNRLFRNAYNQFPIYSEGVTGFVGVEDVARLTLLCFENEASDNQRFLMVSENISFEKVSRLMAQNFMKKPPYIRLNNFLYHLALGWVGLKEFLGFKGLLTTETVKSSISKKTFSNNKTKDMLGFRYEIIEDVIKKSCDLYKKPFT